MSLLTRSPLLSGRSPIMICFGFESNSGGQVHNSDASSGELSESQHTWIWNSITSQLELLHIGVNENLDHWNLVPHTTHGWHLQLKNRSDAGTFVQPLIICEFGQGGSTASMWTSGSTFRNKMIARYNDSIAAVEAKWGRKPIVYFFGSWGINDAIAGTTASAFIPRYYELLDLMNDLYPVRAYFLDVIWDLFPTYQPAIRQMAVDTPNIFVQEMQGKQQDDGYHLGYIGMKAQTNEKLAAMLPLL